MKVTTRWITLAACAGALALGGCSKSDEDKMKDKMEDAAEKVEDAVEDAGDAIEDATDGN
ncbi:MAG: hypothetical protein ACF8XB_00785 [Planctomycetota bacterium JB042]